MVVATSKAASDLVTEALNDEQGGLEGLLAENLKALVKAKAVRHAPLFPEEKATVLVVMPLGSNLPVTLIIGRRDRPCWIEQRPRPLRPLISV